MELITYNTRVDRQTGQGQDLSLQILLRIDGKGLGRGEGGEML